MFSLMFSLRLCLRLCLIGSVLGSPRFAPLLESIKSSHTGPQADGGFFLYQAFRPCQKFCMTPWNILRHVIAFSVVNLKKNLFLALF